MSIEERYHLEVSRVHDSWLRRAQDVFFSCERTLRFLGNDEKADYFLDLQERIAIFFRAYLDLSLMHLMKMPVKHELEERVILQGKGVCWVVENALNILFPRGWEFAE